MIDGVREEVTLNHAYKLELLFYRKNQEYNPEIIFLKEYNCFAIER